MTVARAAVRLDAVGIGCRRCASSWLHGVLNQHPRIGKPKDGVHFFSEQYERGEDWYSSQLAAHASRGCVVEFSVSYTYPEHAELAAQRIQAYAPEARLFATVRNPIDRAFSDYLRSTRLLEIPAEIDFEDAIERYPAYLERGRYGRILEPFFDRFPAERITILFYEDLRRNPAEFVRPLFEMLGVGPELEGLDLARREPPGKRVQRPALNRAVFALKCTADTVMSRVCPNRWRVFKERHMAAYRALLTANTKRVSVSATTRQQLQGYFREDIARFASLVNRDLSYWT